MDEVIKAIEMLERNEKTRYGQGKKPKHNDSEVAEDFNYVYNQREQRSENVIPPVDNFESAAEGEEEDDGFNIPIDQLPPYLQEMAMNDPEGF